MRRQVASGMSFPLDGPCLAALILLVATINATLASDTFASNKDQHAKGYYGLLKDLTDTPRDKKSSSLLNDEGMRFKKASSLLDDEGMRFKKGSSLLDDEGMRFKKTSYLEDEGMRFKKMPSDLMDRNALIRKSVLDGEGLRFKKGSSLLDDEGMRFRRSRMTPRDRQEEVDKIKRYFPGHLLSMYPFSYNDMGNSYERRSDRSGNRDILEGEGMRF